MRTSFWTAFFVFLFCPLAVLAQSSVDGFTPCYSLSEIPGTPLTTGIKIGQNGALCYEFDSDHGAAASALFNVQATAATVCLLADRNSTGGAAVVVIDWCGTDGATANTCEATPLSISASSPCEAIARGLYRFDVTTAPAGTEDAQIVIRGY